MISEKTLARQLLDLGNLKDYLKDAEIECALIEATELIPVHMLVIPMPADHEERDRALSCSFIPVDESYLEHNTLLQIYSELPWEIQENNHEQLIQYLMRINMLQPLGHFGEKDGKVYFRYVLLLERYEVVRASEALEVLRVCEESIDMYAEAIEDVNSGEMSLVDALSELTISE